MESAASIASFILTSSSIFDGPGTMEPIGGRRAGQSQRRRGGRRGPRVIGDEVPGDGVEPRPGTRRSPEGASRAEGPEERLLGDVLGCVDIADAEGDRPDEGPLVAGHEPLEGSQVPAGDPAEGLGVIERLRIDPLHDR